MQIDPHVILMIALGIVQSSVPVDVIIMQVPRTNTFSCRILQVQLHGADTL